MEVSSATIICWKRRGWGVLNGECWYGNYGSDVCML